MAVIATTQAQGFIPQIWLNVALGQLRAYLTMLRAVLRDTDLQAGAFKKGNILNIPQRGQLVVNDKVEGSNYTIQNPTATDLVLTLNKHKEVTFAVESRALSIVNQDIIAGYTQDAVIVLAEQIDLDLLNYAGTLTGVNAAIVGGAALTEANIQSAKLAMTQNRVPAMMKKFGVYSPTQANALSSIPNFSLYQNLGISNNVVNGTVGDGQVTMPGAQGRLYNFEMSETQLLPFASSVYKNVFFSEDAIMVAFRELEQPDPSMGVQASVITDPESGIVLRLLHGYNLQAGAHQITLDCLYGFTANRAAHVQVITTTA